jgi:hypothetical protein
MNTELTIRDLFDHPTIADLMSSVRFDTDGLARPPLQRRTREGVLL